MIVADVDWNPLVVGIAASLPALLALGAGFVAYKQESEKTRLKLREMEITGLKTLHHVNSGTVISARSYEVSTGELVEANPTEKNIAKHKAAILDLERAIITQRETADLLLKMGGKDTPDIDIPKEPLEVVLTSKVVHGTTEELATKQDVVDALKDKNDD